MGKTIKKLLLAVAVAALILFFAPVRFGEAEAKSVYTDVYEDGSPWTWDYSDGARFDQGFARMVNKKTGEVLKNGWHVVDDCWYYFTKGGYIYDEYHDGYYLCLPDIGNYWVEDENPVRWSWKKSGSKWRYVSTDGERLEKTFARIDGKPYYFDENGYLCPNGWYEAKDFGWLYIKKDGSCLTGWKQIKGKWYFFDYYTGLMACYGGVDTSPVGTVGKQYYLFDENGVMSEATGWVDIFEYYWYYLKKDHTVKTGWIKDGSKWYYLDPTSGGEMVRSSYLLDDPKYSWEAYVDGYYIDENGVMKSGGYGWHMDSNGWWYGKGKYYIKGCIGYIDRKECYFGPDGYLTRVYDRDLGQWIEYKDSSYFYD